MAANVGKRVLCTLIVHEIAEHNEHPPKVARVDVDVPATSVAHVLEMVRAQAMTKLKRQK